MADSESTNTSLDERIDDFYDTETRNAIAEGLMTLLRPAIEQLDEKVKSTRITQAELKQQIENLAEDLRRISDNQQVPMDLDGYVKKLMNVKRRVMLVNNILQNAQERLNNIHQSIAKESAKRRSLMEPGSTSSLASSVTSSVTQ